MASTCRQRLCAFALLFIVGSTLCARLPPKKLVVADPSPEDGGVVQLIPPTHGSIVRSHKDNTVPKNSRSEPDLTTLGYVTPWNNHGYDVAKFYPKFSMISPVWIQIVPHEGRFQLKGTHDIDKGWIDDVRKASGNNVLILPRVQTHGFSPDHWIKMWTHEDYTITMITRLCLENGFDGIVLEMWDELGGYIKPHLTKVYQFFKKLRADFDKHDLKLVLVVPPPTSDESKAFFSTTNYKDLISYADYFSIMSYDYSHPYNAGPVSPLPWFSGIIETLVRASPNNRQKILMGINFYGMDYQPPGKQQPIIGRDYISLLSKHKPNIEWDKDGKEHFFKYKENGANHHVYYPTLQSIKQRIEVAKKHQVGIAIWELGQGLDMFYDLL